MYEDFGDDDDEDDEEGDWDDEDDDEDDDDDEEEDLIALAEQLRTPIAAQGQCLKQHMKDTVIPAIQQVQKVHETLDEEGTI